MNRQLLKKELAAILALMRTYCYDAQNKYSKTELILDLKEHLASIEPLSFNAVSLVSKKIIAEIWHMAFMPTDVKKNIIVRSLGTIVRGILIEHEFFLDSRVGTKANILFPMFSNIDNVRLTMLINALKKLNMFEEVLSTTHNNKNILQYMNDKIAFDLNNMRDADEAQNMPVVSNRFVLQVSFAQTLTTRVGTSLPLDDITQTLELAHTMIEKNFKKNNAHKRRRKLHSANAKTAAEANNEFSDHSSIESIAIDMGDANQSIGAIELNESIFAESYKDLTFDEFTLNIEDSVKPAGRDLLSTIEPLPVLFSNISEVDQAFDVSNTGQVKRARLKY